MRLKILVVDAVQDNAERLGQIVRQLGHDVTIARDGVEAVEHYRSAETDLIFMAITLPGLDGIEATRQMRALPSQHWAPIVLQSAADSAEEIVRGMAAGGDDYLAQPTDVRIIQAKIGHYARILTLQRDTQGYLAELGAWRENAEQQNRLAQHVVSRLLAADGLRDPILSWLNVPADSFSGDLVCAARGPDDALYALLADAAGHGLAAALIALPLTQVFYGMAAKGFPIDTIAGELNRKLKSFLPAGHFVAASLVALDVRNQVIEVWNGGNPDVLLLDGSGLVSGRWPSRHLPLGVLPPGQFDATVETVEYAQPSELALFSDGIVEAENPSGESLGLPGIEALLGAAPKGQRLAALKTAVLGHLAGRPGHDDLSALVIQAPIERRQTLRLTRAAADLAEPASDWRLELSWGASERRTVDVVPAVLGFMSQIQALKPYQGQLFLVLSELFNNALDHGLLGLDSSLKNKAGGFQRYHDERRQRLEALTDGRIDMAFRLGQPDARPVLDIRIEDSGQGFDYNQFDPAFDDSVAMRQTNGRGILMVRSLCEEVVYSGRGNVVTARFSG